MSMSSNSKLKAAFTWAGQTRPAVALFSASHSPQFLAFGEGHLPLVVAGSDGAFDRHFSGHFPNITTTARGVGHACRVFSVNYYLGCGAGKSLHPCGPGQRRAHRKGPLNAENAVRPTGLLTAGRNPEDRSDPSDSR